MDGNKKCRLYYFHTRPISRWINNRQTLGGRCAATHLSKFIPSFFNWLINGNICSLGERNCSLKTPVHQPHIQPPTLLNILRKPTHTHRQDILGGWPLPTGGQPFYFNPVRQLHFCRFLRYGIWRIFDMIFSCVVFGPAAPPIRAPRISRLIFDSVSRGNCARL